MSFDDSLNSLGEDTPILEAGSLKTSLPPLEQL